MQHHLKELRRPRLPLMEEDPASSRGSLLPAPAHRAPVGISVQPGCPAGWRMGELLHLNNPGSSKLVVGGPSFSVSLVTAAKGIPGDPTWFFPGFSLLRGGFPASRSSLLQCAGVNRSPTQRGTTCGLPNRKALFLFETRMLGDVFMSCCFICNIFVLPRLQMLFLGTKTTQETYELHVAA